jgi:cell division protein FtsL
MLDLEDKIEKLNKEIESNKKLIDSLNVEINELKVNNFNFNI